MGKVKKCNKIKRGKYIIKNVPNEIYLVLDGIQNNEFVKELDFKELIKDNNISWCSDRISFYDIKYKIISK